MSPFITLDVSPLLFQERGQAQTIRQLADVWIRTFRFRSGIVRG